MYIFLLIKMSIYLSVCLFIYTNIHLSICMSFYLYKCPSVWVFSVCLSVPSCTHLSVFICPCVFMSVYLLICTCSHIVCLVFCLSVYLFIYLSLVSHLFVCPSASLSFVCLTICLSPHLLIFPWMGLIITPSVCSSVSLTIRVYVLLSPFSFVHLSSIMSVHPSVSSYSLVKYTYYNMSVLPSACQSVCLSPLTLQCVYYIACLSVFLSLCPSSNHVSQSVFLSCLLVC